MATTKPFAPSADIAQYDSRFFGHPRGLATLFFIEMWERFSFYGMRALLMLFMAATVRSGGLGFPVAKAGAVYGFALASIYLLSLPGGWIADRLIGQRRAVLYGGMLISLGNFCLMGHEVRLFYTGLGLIMLGTGMLKPNVSTIVGQLYRQGDARRDSGFSIFYIGINVGALIAPLACGWVGERISWRLGFGLAGLGMVAGLIQYAFGGKYLGEAGLYPAPAESAEQGRRLKRRTTIAAAAAALAMGLVAWLAASGAIVITAERVSNAIGIILLVVSIGVFAWLLLGKGWTPAERKRSGAVLVLFLGSMIFWGAFEQAGSSLNLFAERNTNRDLLGFNFPASWFQFVQPFFIITLAPVFAWLWLALKKREPSSPTKFSLGLLFVGLGFALLVPAAMASANGALVSSWWLTGTYFLHTVGELCLSPVGLSAMTKLAPARIGGLMMGMWFVSISIGEYFAGKAASVYESMPLPSLFGTVALFAIGGAVVMALLVRPTVRLMTGVK